MGTFAVQIAKSFGAESGIRRLKPSETQFRLGSTNCYRKFQICPRVGSRNLSADAGLALRHHGIGKGDDIDAFASRSSAMREATGIAEHDRHDRVLAGQEVETGLSSLRGRNGYFRAGVPQLGGFLTRSRP